MNGFDMLESSGREFVFYGSMRVFHRGIHFSNIIMRNSEKSLPEDNIRQPVSRIDPGRVSRIR
jgi:hypothetical protein